MLARRARRGCGWAARRRKINRFSIYERQMVRWRKFTCFAPSKKNNFGGYRATFARISARSRTHSAHSASSRRQILVRLFFLCALGVKNEKYFSCVRPTRVCECEFRFFFHRNIGAWTSVTLALIFPPSRALSLSLAPLQMDGKKASLPLPPSLGIYIRRGASDWTHYCYYLCSFPST
jgi:hypothetical protein